MQYVRQFIKFGLVGGINTILTYLIYLILVNAVTPAVAMGIGYGITSIIGLTMNNKWVFKANSNLHSIAFKYYATYAFTWTLSVICTFVLSKLTTLPAWIIPIGSLLITIPTNFLLSKFWVFKKPKLLKEN